MVRTTSTKEDILRIGKELIQHYGYNAFSYADISKKLNIKNAAVHYHFPTKEELLSAVIDNFIEQYSQLEVLIKNPTLSSKEKVDCFVERYSSCLLNGDCICIIGAVASDYTTLPENVKEKIRALVDLVLKMVEKMLGEGKRKGEFNFKETARNQSLLMMTNLAAGMQLARITGKTDYETIRKSVLKQLIT